MGLFNKKKKEEIKENKVEEKEVDAIGWDAIDKEVDRVYPGQDNPKHYAAIVK